MDKSKGLRVQALFLLLRHGDEIRMLIFRAGKTSEKNRKATLTWW